MSYIKELEYKKRRHPKKQITGKEAIARLNQITDEANAAIARAIGEARHWQQVASGLADENARLRAALAEVRQAKTLGDVRGVANKAIQGDSDG